MRFSIPRALQLFQFTFKKKKTETSFLTCGELGDYLLLSCPDLAFYISFVWVEGIFESLGIVFIGIVLLDNYI